MIYLPKKRPGVLPGRIKGRLMINNNSLTLQDLPGIFQSVKSGRKSSVLSDAEFRHRSMACGCPGYLLSTEITTLLHYVPVFNQKMFIATLTNSGISIAEALNLTPSSFILNARYPYLRFSAQTLRFNQKTNYSKKMSHGEYIIPLINTDYVMQLRKFISEHSMQETAKGNNLLWAVESVTASGWISHAVHQAKMDDIHFKPEVTPDCLRRSFAVSMLTLGIHPDILKRMFLRENNVKEINDTILP